MGVPHTDFVDLDDALWEQTEVTAILVFPIAVATAVGLTGLGYTMMRRRK